MEVICINKPTTYTNTEFIIGKKYSCFKKMIHTTTLNSDGTFIYREEVVDGWYVFDELRNTVEAIESCFIPLQEYREKKLNVLC